MATETNEVKVDSNVATELHPAYVDRIVEAHGEETAAYVAPVRAWFDAAYNSLSDIHAAKAKGLADKTQTNAGMIVKLAGSAARVQDQLMAKADSLTKALTTQLDTLNQSLDAPLTQAANRGHVASEIRQHVKSLTTDKQSAVIREAIGSGNAEVVGAILGAPGMLSGISEEMRRTYTRQWNTRANPLISNRIDALTAALDMLANRAPMVMTQVTKALGADWGQVNALKNANSDFEKALIINRFLPTEG